MIESISTNRKFTIIISLVLCMGIAALCSFKPQKNGTLRITFINTANGKPVSLEDSVYKNVFGEEYTISKLKYYISHVNIPGASQLPEQDPYHLINQSQENNSFEITLKPGEYNSISFLLGVDSAANCSGAQSGALDPMNDMFWTWNTGYVMFKLEGSSPASTSDLQRIEHHIGGFREDYNVITQISLNPASLTVKEDRLTELVIETNLDHYWKGETDIRISENAVCMQPGKLAKKMSSNFKGLFSVKEIIRH